MTESEKFKVRVLCETSEQIDPLLDGMCLDNGYKITILSSQLTGEFKGQFLLSFDFNWLCDETTCDVKLLSKRIVPWLSTILGQKLRIESIRINGKDIPYGNPESIIFKSQTDLLPDEIHNLYARFISMPIAENNNLLEQYIKACELYQNAVLLSASHPNISFFLFVVSVECLSEKNCDLNNFIDFIISNYEEWKFHFPEEEFRILLSSIYHIKSSFTHKGENINKYIILVDQKLKSKSAFTYIDDTFIEFPGLNYLNHIVRNVLLNFLRKQEIVMHEGKVRIDNLTPVVRKDSIAELVPTKAINAGDTVCSDAIKHRK